MCNDCFWNKLMWEERNSDTTLFTPSLHLSFKYNPPPHHKTITWFYCRTHTTQSSRECSPFLIRAMRLWTSSEEDRNSVSINWTQVDKNEYPSRFVMHLREQHTQPPALCNYSVPERVTVKICLTPCLHNTYYVILENSLLHAYMYTYGCTCMWRCASVVNDS